MVEVGGVPKNPMKNKTKFGPSSQNLLRKVLTVEILESWHMCK